LQKINKALKQLFYDVSVSLFLAHLYSQMTVIHAVIKDSEDWITSGLPPLSSI